MPLGSISGHFGNPILILLPAKCGAKNSSSPATQPEIEPMIPTKMMIFYLMVCMPDDDYFTIFLNEGGVVKVGTFRFDYEYDFRISNH